MKLSSLSVRKLLRAIAAPVMLASTLLSGSFASAETIYIAEGVDMEDYYGSERFNRCAKAAYMHYWDLQAEYERTGSLDFLGELAKYVVPNAEGKIDLTDRTCTAELRDTEYMCWSHATSDVIQYWQTYYGVFYKGERPLPYGFNYSRETLKLTGGGAASQVCTLFTDNWTNAGGNIWTAVPWYFQGVDSSHSASGSQLETIGQGGYSYGVTISTIGSSYDISDMTREQVLGATAKVLGYTYNGDSWERNERARIGWFHIGYYDENGEYSGHAITCWGFKVDENGELKSLYLSDNNYAEYSVREYFLKKGGEGLKENRWYLYSDEECTTPFYYRFYLMDIVTIDTPDILEQKYAAYHADDSVLVWNGKRADGAWSEASSAEATLDVLPTEANGWKIYAVDDYYNSYYQQEKNVRFDDTADSTAVAVKGYIAAKNWEIDNTTKTYSFTGGEKANLTVDSLSKSGTGTASLTGLTVSAQKVVDAETDSVLATGALTVSAGTLAVGGCTLSFDSASVASSATLSITSSSSLTVANALTLASGSTLNFVLGSADSTALLSFSGTFTPSSLVSLTVDGTKAESGKVYHLVSYTGSGLSSTDVFSCSQGLLTYADSTLSLTYYKGGYLVWDSGDGEWSSTRWETEDKTTNMAGLLFTGEGAGKTANISLTGDVNPAKMAADNAGTIVIGGSGRIVGTSSLTMSGSGELRLNTANTYTGGTVVEAGTLTAGHADALGTGKVSLKGGTLDLGGNAVENAIEVQGDATMNGASSYLGGLTLTSGALTGGQINLAQTLELRSGSIANRLVGGGGVLKLGEGKVTLSGNNTYTGRTVISAGTLELAAADSLGEGDVELNGGILEATSGITLGSGQKLLLKGGAIVGDITLDGGEIDMLSATSISGSLTLDGGLMTFRDKMMTVSGTLTIADDTTFDVSCWTETGIYRAMRIDGLVGNPEDVDFITNSRNTYELVHNGSYLVLSVSADPQTIYWDKAQGVWQERGEVEWTPAPGESLVDARFFAKDDVVFAQGGDVTIEGTVLPGSVKVSGEEALYLGGSGSIGGAASLRKEGTGLLVMNEANTYTGGTVIEDGTVIAGGDRSFGSGAIRLNGGMLDLGDYETENDITATGGALKSTAFGGDLIVNGDLQVGPQTRARSIRLQSGSISGIPALSRARSAGASGSIVDTPVDAVSGRLNVDLLGTTSLVVSQDVVTVSGHNSYSGGTVVESGELVVEEGSSLGTGAISLMGGILRAQGSGLSLLPGQAMQMKGGRMTGNLHTSVGSLLEVTPGSSISGGLTLGGGLVSFCYTTTAWDTTALTIGGELKVTELTSITLSGTYTQDAVLMSFGSMSGDVEKLVLVDAEGTPCEDLALVREENSIVLKSAESAAAAGSSKWEYDAAVLNDLLAQSNWGIFHASHAFINTIQGEKFSGTQVGEDSTVWASAIHSFASHDGSATNMGADISHTGGAVGYEMLVGEGSCIGMALGMMAGEVQTEGSPMEMDQESTHIGIYGATRLYADSKSALTLSGYAAYGMYESTPKAQYAHTEWMQNAVQLNVRLDGSRALSENLWVSAFAGLEYFSATDDTVDGISTGELKNLRLELGSGVTWQSSKLTLHAEAAFLADIARDNPAPTVLGTCGGAANPGRLGVGISGGAAYSITPSWSVNANANADFVDGASSCSVNLGTAIRF